MGNKDYQSSVVFHMFVHFNLMQPYWRVVIFLLSVDVEKILAMQVIIEGVIKQNRSPQRGFMAVIKIDAIQPVISDY